MAAVLSMYMDICRFFFGSGAKKEHNRLDCIKKQQVASPPDGHGVSVDGQKKYISRFFLFHALARTNTKSARFHNFFFPFSSSSPD